MKTRIGILTLVFLLIIIGQIVGQTTYNPTCYIYTINSQNDKYFLQTFPFDNIVQTSTGKTIVYNSDSLEIYKIERYFEIADNDKEVFLSNDGKTIIYVIDKEFTWKGVKNESIQIFKNGILYKQYQLIDLINCDFDDEDCFLFYKDAIDSISWKNRKKEITYKENATDFEKELTRKATFLNNDTLYIFTKTKNLIIIDMNTTVCTIFPFEEIDENLFSHIIPFEIKYKEFKPASLYGFPKLSNGQSFEKGLAKYLDMAIYPKFKKKSKKYKMYMQYFEILIDTLGNASLDNMGDDIRLPKDKVKSFIESQKFEASSNPKVVEKWRFSGYVQLMNKNKKQAKKEKKQEILEEREAYKKRVVADSINGLYIPQNLEECFIELNKLLKQKDIETIKNLENREETLNYHFVLGMWLRNNWGLWGGSRLKEYLFKKGITHPDEMSRVILEFYYDWLNENNDEWRKFELQ